MAIGAGTCWRIRADGANTNGGGYDPTISGAGTDYTDQASAQLTLTDLATSGAGSTTLTSATGGFTAAMIGNCFQITSGTNFQTGYYFVTAYTDTNTVTVDRTPTSGGAGSGGNGKLGGAWGGGSNLDFQNLATSAGTKSAPSVTTPLAAGHTVYIRGSGGSNPGSADYTQTGYYVISKSGNATNGSIRFVGYNGRPRIDIDNPLCYSLQRYSCQGLHIKYTGATDTANCLSDSAGDWIDCWVDQAGYDRAGPAANIAIGCWLFNSGSTSAGTSGRPALKPTSTVYGGLYSDCVIEDWRAEGIYAQYTVHVRNCVVSGTKKDGIYLSTVDGYPCSVINCTIYNATGSGIYIANTGSMVMATLVNNVITGNSAYGINAAVGSTALNDNRLNPRMKNNFFYSNTSGNRNNVSAGSGDVSLSGDPFVSAGSDFSLNNTSGAGASVRAGAYVGIASAAIGTPYADGGAIQHQDSGGGGGGFFRVPSMGGGMHS